MAKNYATAENRWSGIGPYYAMFPTGFADNVVQEYAVPGDFILDPFAGRGTSLYSSAVHERIGIGIELNPVGWIYGKTKLSPGKPEKVLARIRYLARESSKFSSEARALPNFFHYCFSCEIRAFLLSAQASLDWRNNCIDRTTMAFLLVYLHGKMGQALSNQMRQTKSMAPSYSINWWRCRKLRPPEVDPVEFLVKRIEWRYKHGTPKTTHSYFYLGDCLRILPKLFKRQNNEDLPKIRLLFTSPPYCGVTNYHYDQWLRLWLLGYPNMSQNSFGKHKGRFCNRDSYIDLLLRTFDLASHLLAEDAVIYVRTDSRDFTYQATRNILKKVFPSKAYAEMAQPFSMPTQTHLFGDKSHKNGEIDIILTPN